MFPLIAGSISAIYNQTKNTIIRIRRITGRRRRERIRRRRIYKKIRKK